MDCQGVDVLSGIAESWRESVHAAMQAPLAPDTTPSSTLVLALAGWLWGTADWLHACVDAVYDDMTRAFPTSTCYDAYIDKLSRMLLSHNSVAVRVRVAPDVPVFVSVWRTSEVVRGDGVTTPDTVVESTTWMPAIDAATHRLVASPRMMRVFGELARRAAAGEQAEWVTVTTSETGQGLLAVARHELALTAQGNALISATLARECVLRRVVHRICNVSRKTGALDIAASSASTYLRCIMHVATAGRVALAACEECAQARSGIQCACTPVLSALATRVLQLCSAASDLQPRHIIETCDAMLAIVNV